MLSFFIPFYKRMKRFRYRGGMLLSFYLKESNQRKRFKGVRLRPLAVRDEGRNKNWQRSKF